MGGETGNLVSKSLGLDDCNVVDDSLIYMEVVGQPKHTIEQVSEETRSSCFCNSGRYLLAVVLLNKCSGCSLNSLGSNSAL